MRHAQRSKARSWRRASWGARAAGRHRRDGSPGAGAPQAPGSAHRDRERHRSHHDERFALARFSPQERKFAARGGAACARRQGRRARERREHRRGDDGRAVRARHAAFGRSPGAGGGVSEHEGKSLDHSRRRRERRFEARADRAIRGDGRNLLPHDLGREAAARRTALDRRRRDEGQRADARGWHFAEDRRP